MTEGRRGREKTLLCIMHVMIWFCVFARIVANPCSNVFQKLLTRRSAEPLFVICATHGLLTLAVLPALYLCASGQSATFWTNMAIGSLLTVAGNALLVQAVKLTDLSVLGPINAYKAVVSLIPGAILLHEIPGVWGLGGIGLIVAGTYFLTDRDQAGLSPSAPARLLRDRGVQCRIAALVLSAVEAVFMKRRCSLRPPRPRLRSGPHSDSASRWRLRPRC